MYRQYILEVFKNMSHKHELNDETHTLKGVNASCGDSIVVHLKVNNEIIEEASFTGDGCLLSQVSAELLMDKISGRKISDFRDYTYESMQELVGISPTMSRIKCLDLSRHALVDILKQC